MGCGNIFGESEQFRLRTGGLSYVILVVGGMGEVIRYFNETSGQLRTMLLYSSKI